MLSVVIIADTSEMIDNVAALYFQTGSFIIVSTADMWPVGNPDAALLKN
jgi:hypothetical protein